jgi:aspartate/methionine/tyrosine aminotransferase
VFSERSRVGTEPNLLSRLLDSARAQGRTLLDLTASSPPRVGLAHDAAVLTQALIQPGAVAYDPQPFGLPAARARVAREVSGLGVAVRTEQVVLTASTSEAYSYAFKLFCNPGDEVLIAQPGYPLLEHLARLESVKVVPYRLAYDGMWHIDFASLKAAITSRTRCICVVHPNNPTGSFVQQAELRELERLGLPLVSDEVFGAYPWSALGGKRASTLLGAQGLVLGLGGLSKYAGLPQLKLGWLVVGGQDAELRTRALERLEVIADTYLSVAVTPQLALDALLASGARIRQGVRLRCRRNLAWLERRCVQSTVTLLRAEGGWYSVLRLPALLSEDAYLERFVACDGVVVYPGWLYDFDIDPVMIVSLLTEPETFRSGIERVLERVRRVVQSED